MRALVTGGSGFIGANLVRRLLRDGHETHLVLRESYRPWRLTGIESEVEIHLADLQDRDAVQRMVRSIRPQWVFNLAAYGAYPLQTDVFRMSATNFTACVGLLDACAAAEVEAFVEAGTSSEYGYKDHPAREEEAVAPNSAYAVTKVAATHYCRFVAQHCSSRIVILRLYSIYGPFEEPARLIPTLIVRGLAGRLPPLASPDTARDLVFVDDAIEAMILAAKTPAAANGRLYNVCSGIQYNLAQVVDVVRTMLNVQEQPIWGSMAPREWDTDVWVGSPSLIRQQLGWSADTTLEDGLRRTMQWFGDAPEPLQRIYRESLAPK